MSDLLERLGAYAYHRHQTHQPDCVHCKVCADIRDAKAEIERLQAVLDAARKLANHWTTSDEALKAKMALLDAIRAYDGEVKP